MRNNVSDSCCEAAVRSDHPFKSKRRDHYMEELNNGSLQALVIVHLSSLDAFTYEYGFANGAEVACQLTFAIQAHAGLVVVLDQGWPFNGETSDPRQLVLKTLEKHPQVIWFSHSEDTPVDFDPWDQPMQQLGNLLHDHGITSVILGGCFASKDDTQGCVNATQKALEMQRFVCQIDEDLCAFEE
jgi:hypothetical protein